MNLEEKLIELETKLTFQEDTIEQLNRVIIDQQKKIDKISNQLLRLDSKISENLTQQDNNSNQHEIPPHY